MFSADMSFSDRINIELNLPRKWQLSNIERELVEKLEDLLSVRYGDVPPLETQATIENPEVKDIAKQLISYYYSKFTISFPPSNTKVLRWLGLKFEDLPPSFVMKEDLELRQNLSGLISYGFLNDTSPCLAPHLEDGVTHTVELEAGSRDVRLSARTRVNHVIIAPAIVQAQLIIRTEHSMYTGLYDYTVQCTVGTSHSPLQFLSASDAFSRSVELRCAVSNARGAKIHSFREHLDQLLEVHHPTVLIIIETRHGAEAAHQLAARINFQHVEIQEPVSGNGGIWIMPRHQHFRMEVRSHSAKWLRINLLCA